MKKNIIFMIFLIIVSWILFTIFSYAIAYIVTTLALQKSWIFRILNLIFGVALFAVWLLIWYGITRYFFKRNLRNFKEKYS